MLKIGEFARACGVSAQTIRYYDTEGILCADYIDPVSGYRYYAPEKLETFRCIQTYKEAGFSLEEIKLLLAADIKSRDAMMQAKRQEIQKQLRLTEFKLSRLESMFRWKERFGAMEFKDCLRSDFEDDPAVHGRWELCGRLPFPMEGSPPRCTSPIVPFHAEGEAIPRFVLLPHGEHWWMLFWSRGVLYQLIPPTGEVLPQRYTLWEEGGVRYMTVYYVTYGCLYGGEDPIWLLYRQTLHADLTELEARAFVDDTNYPIVSDPDVLGEWRTVAFTKEPEAFTLGEIPRKPVSWWILGMTFLSRGSCLRHFAGKGRAYDGIYPYTRFQEGSSSARGAVLSPSLHIAEEYLLREVEGETYLFIQHKSGDYYYGGRRPGWYVFRRMSHNTQKGGTYEQP